MLVNNTRTRQDYRSECVDAADFVVFGEYSIVAAWPLASSIAETADVRYTRAAPIQVNTLRSITRTTNQRPYK